MALCLYRFKANLFPDFSPNARFDNLDKRINSVSLISFSSFFLLEDLFCSSSFVSGSSSSCVRKLFIPFNAASQSIFEFFINLDIYCHKVSFSDSEFHISKRSVLDKKLSNSSCDDIYEVVSKNFFTFIFNSS